MSAMRQRTFAPLSPTSLSTSPISSTNTVWNMIKAMKPNAHSTARSRNVMYPISGRMLEMTEVYATVVSNKVMAIDIRSALLSTGSKEKTPRVKAQSNQRTSTTRSMCDDGLRLTQAKTHTFPEVRIPEPLSKNLHDVDKDSSMGGFVDERTCRCSMP
eukprot:CAMPEP_0204058556 /NCGR_PEP_ID=MMETSP0360-20130528/136214_1 /ASSEMBLY_ACC=CAM_ASM_000342 /TAXON_ID=268821 /ORGANISM="Scrippsiella Hangoei, Strain SHTV-5" /LENGTH=157 /DNA_ID=CAMNT_0051006097 /DNA_START=132 /DNA_END=605 /DNA_ORIENTATION=-